MIANLSQNKIVVGHKDNYPFLYGISCYDFCRGFFFSLFLLFFNLPKILIGKKNIFHPEHVRDYVHYTWHDINVVTSGGKKSIRVDNT